jgi:hypothetical protein
MDFDLNGVQSRSIEALRDAVGSANSIVTSGLADGCSPEVESTVSADPLLVGPELSLLDRVLLVEEATRLGAPIHATATLFLGPGLGAPPGRLCVRTSAPTQPMRFAEHAYGVIDITSNPPTYADVSSGSYVQARSGMVEGLGSIEHGVATPLNPSSALPAPLLYQLGRAAEIAGSGRAALDATAAHLASREQFGRALSSFQALQHRVSELAVDVEATSALVRNAAFEATPQAILGAASFAAEAAATLVPDLHQLNGARGFTTESGIPAHTMRLTANRVELKSLGVSAVAFADAFWRN